MRSNTAAPVISMCMDGWKKAKGRDRRPTLTGRDERLRGRLATEMGERQRGADAFQRAEVAEDH